MWHGPKKEERYDIYCEYQLGPFDTQPEKKTAVF